MSRNSLCKTKQSSFIVTRHIDWCVWMAALISCLAETNIFLISSQFRCGIFCHGIYFLTNIFFRYNYVANSQQGCIVYSLKNIAWSCWFFPCIVDRTKFCRQNRCQSISVKNNKAMLLEFAPSLSAKIVVSSSGLLFWCLKYVQCLTWILCK